NSEGNHSVESCATNPITMPPTTAPNALPRPPRITPANMSNNRLKPISQYTASVSPYMTPPKAASPPPRIQTTRITRSTSMPEADARSRLSATARVALPIRVRKSMNAVPNRTRIDSPIMNRSRGANEIGPHDRAFCTVYWSYRCRREPYKTRITWRRSSEMPIETTNIWIMPVCRRRILRQIPRSMIIARMITTPIARIVARISGMLKGETLKKYADTAPATTSSPWAKLMRRVVPKTSDKPIAVIAMMIPSLKPNTSRWTSRLRRAARFGRFFLLRFGVRGRLGLFALRLLGGFLGGVFGYQREDDRTFLAAAYRYVLKGLTAFIARMHRFGKRVQLQLNGVGTAAGNGNRPAAVGLAGIATNFLTVGADG